MHMHLTPCNTPENSSSNRNHQTMTRHVMSSREIAELTGKRHDHVIRDVRGMLTELEIASPKLGGRCQHETGSDRTAYQTLITPKGLVCLAEKNIGASL